MGRKLEESGHKKVIEYIVEERVHPSSGKKIKVRTRLRALRVLASLEGPLSGASVHFGLRIWRRFGIKVRVLKEMKLEYKDYAWRLKGDRVQKD